jgi:hypothetical protein
VCCRDQKAGRDERQHENRRTNEKNERDGKMKVRKKKEIEISVFQWKQKQNK